MKTQSEVMKEVDESFKKDTIILNTDYSIGDEVEAAIRKLQDEHEKEINENIQKAKCTFLYAKTYNKIQNGESVIEPKLDGGYDGPYNEPDLNKLASDISEPIDDIQLEMEREAIAQRCIAFSRQQAGVASAANIYDAYVAKNFVRLLTWHFDACKHPGSELADLSFEKIRKVGEI